VLILGGTRFIGRRIAADLVARGDEVTVVHRGQTETAEPDGCSHWHTDRAALAGLSGQVRALRPDAVIDTRALTKADAGLVIPVVITVYQDKSFTFITKSPPASILLKKAAGITAGSKTPNKEKVGKVTRKQVMDIVKMKSKDINSNSEEAAFRIISGTARSMGIEVVG